MALQSQQTATRRSLLMAIAGAVLLLSTGTSMAAGVTGICNTTKTAFHDTAANIFTTSTTFVSIPDSGVTFVKGGSSAGCVIVHFTAQVLTFGTGSRMKVELNFDGNAIADVSFSSDDLSTSARSTDFVLLSVAPGKHKVSMLWQSPTGATIQMFEHITLVQFQ